MPQKKWTKKDERQYGHIKESEKERGRSEDRAEEIAAATVNKQRRKEGRTESSGSRKKQGSGGSSSSRSSAKSGAGSRS